MQSNKRKRNFALLAAILKMCYIGSPSQFSDGGIDFSWLDKSPWSHDITLVRSWLVHVGYIASIGLINVISAGFWKQPFWILS